MHDLEPLPLPLPAPNLLLDRFIRAVFLCSLRRRTWSRRNRRFPPPEDPLEEERKDEDEDEDAHETEVGEEVAALLRGPAEGVVGVDCEERQVRKER
jgi:hypothetical protein